MSNRISILALDPHSELRTSLYAHWREKYDVEVVSDVMGSVAPIVKSRYTIVFCPVIAYALDVPQRVAGVDIAEQVIALNEEYAGRFLFYCTPEVRDIASKEKLLPPEEAILVLEPPLEECLGKADASIETTLRRMAEARRQQG